jgi:hypothetical protein
MLLFLSSLVSPKSFDRASQFEVTDWKSACRRARLAPQLPPSEATSKPMTKTKNDQMAAHERLLAARSAASLAFCSATVLM